MKMANQELPQEFTDERTGLIYTLIDGLYYLPCYEEQAEKCSMGKFGRMHQRYLKEHRRLVYQEFVLNGTLYDYLLDIDRAAHAQWELVTKQMAEREGVDEALKERDQLGWVQSMNSIRNRAEEIVLHNLIYT
jgi:hypothetical protein